MVSKIIFLGTAGDSFVYGRQIRSSGGIAIKTGGYQFIIDPGPGALLRMKQCAVHTRETTAVICTHKHPNHASELNAIVSAMSLSGSDRIGVIITSKSVSEENSNVLSDFHKACVERVITLDPGKRVGIENLEIRALKAFHDDEETIGIKLFSPDFIMCYSSDTSYNKELIEEYKNCDILILNVVSPKDGKNNLSLEDTSKLISKVKPQLCIITHFGKEMIQLDPIIEARNLQKESGVQVIAATDGMVISPNYYSAEIKQKTLNLYKNKDEIKEENVPNDN